MSSLLAILGWAVIFGAFCFVIGWWAGIKSATRAIINEPEKFEAILLKGKGRNR